MKIKRVVISKACMQFVAFCLLIVGSFCYCNSQAGETVDIQSLMKAAEDGDIPAQINLGVRYSSGDGVPKSEAKAVEWFEKAAQLGGKDAEYMIGHRYWYGYGTPQSESKAAGWFAKAAAHGSVGAQASLGIIYMNGNGDVLADYAKAAEWLRRAAQEGVADAQYRMGELYKDGKGVPRDVVLAYAWFNVAAAQHYGVSADDRDAVGKEMTEAQVAEAQRISGDWKQGQDIRRGSDHPSQVESTNDAAPALKVTGDAEAVYQWLRTPFKVYWNHDSALYVIPGSIRRRPDGTVTAWDVLDHAQDQPPMAGGKEPYRSTQSLMAFDCDARKFAFIQVAFYAGQMGQGKTTRSLDPVSKENFFNVMPNSLVEPELDFACNLAPKTGYLKEFPGKVSN